MNAAEPRYAEALYYAAKSEETESIGQVLTEFNRYLQTNPDLRVFLFNPAISLPIRKETACLLLPKDTPETAKRFLFLLLDRRRMRQLSGICAAYQQITGQRQERLDLCVTTAHPLEAAQLARIREKYQKRYHAKAATLRQQIDPTLLGGVRVQIGDIVIDDSLRARLEGLREALRRQ